MRDGFWGSLAAGATLADMNQPEPVAERQRGMRREMPPSMAIIERVVGAMSGITRGQAPADLVAGFHRFATSLGADVPAWLTEPMMRSAAERMRRLIGEWRALRPGQSMTLDWPPESRSQGRLQ